jgi:hypothetical protein
MNAKEGLRRIALAAGILGGCAGVIGTYIVWQGIAESRSNFKAFSSLMASGEVKDNIKADGGFTVTSTEFTPDNPSELGIKRINYELSQDGKTSKVSYIEMNDGKAYFPFGAPKLFEYLLLPGLPILGFFVPWGGISLLSWIIAGFQEPKTT